MPIFDLDGTLYKTESATIKAVDRALKECGLSPPDGKFVRSLIGETMENFCRRLVPHLSEDRLDNLREKISIYEKELIPTHAELYGGMRNILNELTETGLPAALCSNGSRRYVDLVLDACRVRDKFAYVRTNDVKTSKGELVRELLNESGYTKAVMIGDRIHDFRAAAENNVLSVGVTWGYGGGETAEADFCSNNPDDILKIIYQCLIFSRIEKDLVGLRKNAPFIVGINGIDNSGKTTFAVNLDIYLRKRGYMTQLIHMDDFHNPKEIRMQGNSEIDAYINNAFNLNLLRDEILYPAREFKRVDKHLKLLDLDSDTFTKIKKYHIDNDTIVIVEGVLLYRKPIDEFFDYRIFLKIEFDECLNRARRRDVPRYGESFLDKYHRKYIPIQKWYIETSNPLKLSNLVIDNNEFIRPRIIEK